MESATSCSPELTWQHQTNPILMQANRTASFTDSSTGSHLMSLLDFRELDRYSRGSWLPMAPLTPACALLK